MYKREFGGRGNWSQARPTHAYKQCEEEHDSFVGLGCTSKKFTLREDRAGAQYGLYDAGCLEQLRNTSPSGCTIDDY
jgi:hypothetical protein